MSNNEDKIQCDMCYSEIDTCASCGDDFENGGACFCDGQNHYCSAGCVAENLTSEGSAEPLEED